MRIELHPDAETDLVDGFAFGQGKQTNGRRHARGLSPFHSGCHLFLHLTHSRVQVLYLILNPAQHQLEHFLAILDELFMVVDVQFLVFAPAFQVLAEHPLDFAGTGQKFVGSVAHALVFVQEHGLVQFTFFLIQVVADIIHVFEEQVGCHSHVAQVAFADQAVKDVGQFGNLVVLLVELNE